MQCFPWAYLFPDDAVGSLAPRLRGEGWGEGLSPRVAIHRETCTPSPGLHLRCNPTSPRKRGEVRSRTRTRERDGRSIVCARVNLHLCVVTGDAATERVAGRVGRDRAGHAGRE